MGTWSPPVMVHNAESGKARHILTGKKRSRSPCTTSVRTGMTANYSEVKSVSSALSWNTLNC